MLILRSLLFNIAFYLNLAFWMIVLLPALPLPRRVFMRGAKFWAWSSMWLMRVIAGTKVEFRGLERIPPGGLLVASKHQSVWETFALLTLFQDPAFILKRELMWLPFFGWYTWKGGSVPVNRKGGAQALLQMMARAKGEIQKGRQILIFPEGTRRPAGAPPAYKFGIGHLYQHLGAPCLPIALNSGLFWSRRKFLRRPGTIIVEILEVIPPGMPRNAFFKEMQDRIETASDRLLAEGHSELARIAGSTAPDSSAA
ncbi:lysophospholipid acyltransferase family protein [Microvirga brassicacearum]|uniref:1-acyl-sn-glycerol-3-phosphate acyltransferase n=1 Tax=Microvirga brassicacearum TaxID=2580413 RepID=A0A5N3P682_9HYPH|nr:lysophospholipid acyltransferase family protein [Microvirga brassicacearum]KAB0265230.1 1-acyl-sn-glycerol-3-phosphate acyltransferase [Microvirga brassicacearum]